jgi:hypothetical protein
MTGLDTRLVCVDVDSTGLFIAVTQVKYTKLNSVEKMS